MSWPNALGIAGWTYTYAKSFTPQAHDNYRVILKCDDGEFEIGSIGIPHDGGWSWGVGTVIPMRTFETRGEGRGPQGLHAAEGGVGALCFR